MADLNDILLLGDPRLYQKSMPVTHSELAGLKSKVRQMSELVRLFRLKYGVGRAIAAPQIGLMKRIIVINIDKPQVLFNPVLTELSKEIFEMWDDCMSFPNLLVKVARHQSCIIEFKDSDWQEQSWTLEGAMSELIQHEYDHLNGILAIQRALDNRSFKWRPTPSA